jgi:hypothetical protein
VVATSALFFVFSQSVAARFDQPPLPGQRSTSFEWVDVDRDGRLDLAAVTGAGTLHLLVNAGNRFEDVTERVGLAGVGNAALASWADYDADGRLDLLVGAREGGSVLFHNEGGTFVDRNAASGFASEGAVQWAQWFDHDGDGRLDLFVVTSGKNQLFRGLEGGFFEPVELPLAVIAADGLPASGALAVPVPEGVRARDSGATEGTTSRGGFVVFEERHEVTTTGAMAGPTARPTGSPPLMATPGVLCATSVEDSGAPGNCLQATSVPTPGLLFPPPHDGGVNNVSSGTNSFIGGGQDNQASNGAGSGHTTVGGGRSNIASGDFATVGGGCTNFAMARAATVAGGDENDADGPMATIAGGQDNEADGLAATIPGGKDNNAQGDYSFAAGRRAKADHDGAFVWGDSQDVDKTSSAADEFNVYAEGGARIFSAGTSVPSMVVDAAGSVGIATSTPTAKLDVAGTARMTDTLTLVPSGDQALDMSTGSLYKGGALFMHTKGAGNNTAVGRMALMSVTDGFGNTATGREALFSNTSGYTNTAVGDQALRSNTVGTRNTAHGSQALARNTTGMSNTATGEHALAYNTTASFNTATGTSALWFNTTGYFNTGTGGQALLFNTTGSGNTATGFNALLNNTIGYSNTACGLSALISNTTGADNTACGYRALDSNTTGARNVAVGRHAGSSLTTGNDNIAIGNVGVAAEGGTIRIGTSGTHTRAFIAGIRGVTTGVANAIPVLIDGAGQLGTVSSSRRFKEEIRDMGDATERLLDLRPVTFRYKPDVQQGERPLEYGLIAEEVAEVFPDLVVYDEEGRPFTVKYHLLSSMLLNQLKRQARELEEQRGELARLRRLETRVAAVEARISSAGQPAAFR